MKTIDDDIIQREQKTCPDMSDDVIARVQKDLLRPAR